jgi:hypothetical protein
VGWVLGYALILNILWRGWMDFSFRTEEDVGKILFKLWKWDSLTLTLRKWPSTFDSRTERVRIVPFLVKVPRLILEFWMEEVFRERNFIREIF